MFYLLGRHIKTQKYWEDELIKQGASVVNLVRANKRAHYAIVGNSTKQKVSHSIKAKNAKKYCDFVVSEQWLIDCLQVFVCYLYVIYISFKYHLYLI